MKVINIDKDKKLVTMQLDLWDIREIENGLRWRVSEGLDLWTERNMDLTKRFKRLMDFFEKDMTWEEIYL
jgi:hypothetical protein